MSLRRQLASFTGIGVIQWLIDSAMMMALSHIGLAVAWAVVAGRISGALAGYLLNGRYTFAASHPSLSKRSLQRFVLFWLATTALSAFLLAQLADHASLQVAWLAKPLLDGALAAAGFLAGRYWIYRAN